MTDEVRNRLARALHDSGTTCLPAVSSGGTGVPTQVLWACSPGVHEAQAEAILNRDPALSDAIGLGLAWAECEAAAGPDDMIWVGRGAHGYTARCDAPPGVQTPKSPRAHGSTPTEALQALTVALGEREGSRP